MSYCLLFSDLPLSFPSIAYYFSSEGGLQIPLPRQWHSKTVSKALHLLFIIVMPIMGLRPQHPPLIPSTPSVRIVSRVSPVWNELQRSAVPLSTFLKIRTTSRRRNSRRATSIISAPSPISRPWVQHLPRDLWGDG